MKPLNKLEKRILDISYKKKLAHLSSCLTAVRLIDHIYLVKKHDEPFILDNGHAGLALYVVLEKFHFKDAEQLFDKHGVHPNRDAQDLIYASTGSLGHGIGIAVGMALADKTKDVYVLTSDGAMTEGSNWEALRIAGEQRLENLRVTVNANGHSAYEKVDADLLEVRMQYFYPSFIAKTNLLDFPDWLQGLAGHYVTMTEEQYKEVTSA
jgi:transketolase N-terminal domain/subunit